MTNGCANRNRDRIIQLLKEDVHFEEGYVERGTEQIFTVVPKRQWKCPDLDEGSSTVSVCHSVGGFSFKISSMLSSAGYMTACLVSIMSSIPLSDSYKDFET